MAEALFRKLVDGRDDYEVASAGIGAYGGDSMSEHSAALLKEAGISPNGFTSQVVTPELLEKATHIFAMGRNHMRSIESMYPEAADKIYLASEFSPDDRLRGTDVSDPFGMDISAYRETRNLLSKLLPTILAYIDQTFDKSSTAST